MSHLTPSETDLLARAEAWIRAHHDEFVQDIIQWVAVPSVADVTQGEDGAPFGPAVAEVLRLVTNRADEFGFTTSTHEGYAITVLGDGKDGQPEIGLASHLDVVPAGENWTTNPYEPFYKDGYVIGRGASDNKGPAVLDLYLLRFFRELGNPLHRRLRVIYGGAEEVGMPDLEYYAKHGPVPEISLVTDGPFPTNYAQKGGLNVQLFIPATGDLSTFVGGVAENAVPASSEVILSGHTRAEIETAFAEIPERLRRALTLADTPAGVAITARGKSGHAAFPEGTENAILVLANALLESGLLTPQDHKAATALATLLSTPYGDGSGVASEDEVSGRLTQNGGLLVPVDGGLALHLDIRYPVTVSHEDLLDTLREAVAPYGGHVLGFTNAAPFYIAPDSAVVQLLQSTFNDVLNVDTQPFAMGGGTHSRVLPNAITFGPGIGRIDGIFPEGLVPGAPSFIPEGHGSPHGPDEYVSIENLITAFRIYVLALTRLDDGLQHG